MNKIVEAQFDCLISIFDMGALCQELDEKKEPTGRFKAIASPRVNASHPGWSSSIISALYLMRLLSKNGSGEFTITPRGKAACLQYRAEQDRRAVIAAAQAQPDKIVLLSDFRKGGEA